MWHPQLNIIFDLAAVTTYSNGLFHPTLPWRRGYATVGEPQRPNRPILDVSLKMKDKNAQEWQAEDCVEKLAEFGKQ